MALYLKEGSEESNIRGLVETCAHNDDITPLVKLVFEAQALADTPPSIAGTLLAHTPLSYGRCNNSSQQYPATCATQLVLQRHTRTGHNNATKPHLSA